MSPLRFLSPIVLLALAACGPADTDGDGVPDEFDAFPEDATEHTDLDGDGVGDNADVFPADANNSTDADGDGYGNASDCDDTRADVNPSATEVPYSGLDEDCNADTPDDDLDGDGVLAAEDCDDAVASVSAEVQGYLDADGDGFGSGDLQSFCAATLSDGYSVLNGDCDDADSARNPGFAEAAYDGIDQDCDGEDLWDVDGDGHTALGAPSGSADDCVDTDSSSSPSAVDTAGDDVDQDCSGDAFDVDNDGHDDVLGDDCDDANAAVSPGLDEVFDNGVDDDCDATTSDTDTDADQDGFISLAAGGDDCDDTNDAVYPGQVERPDNGVDDDCDGAQLSALGSVGLYVNSDDANCAASSGSASAPFCTFEQAFDVASEGDVLFVSGGPYATVTPSADVSIHGGYDSDWAQGATTRFTGEEGVGALENLDGYNLIVSGLELYTDARFHATCVNQFGGSLVLVDSTLFIDTQEESLGIRISQASGHFDNLFITGETDNDLSGIVSTESDTNVINSTISIGGPEPVGVYSGRDTSFVITDSVILLGPAEEDATGIRAYQSDNLEILRNQVDIGFSMDDVDGVIVDECDDSRVVGNTISVSGAQEMSVLYLEGNGAVARGNTLVGGQSYDGEPIAVTVAGEGAVFAENVVYASASHNGSTTAVSVSTTAIGATIRDNLIFGGISYGQDTMGLYVGAQAVLTRNTIIGGHATGEAVGVALGSEDVTLVNNAIVGGIGTTAVGLVQNNASASVVHNVITAGRGESRSVGIDAGAQPLLLLNNVVSAGSADSGLSAIYADSSSDIYAYNNAFWVADDTASLFTRDGESSIDELASLHSSSELTAADNTTIGDVFVSSPGNDFHVSPGLDPGDGLDPDSLPAGTWPALDNRVNSDVDGELRSNWSRGIDELN